MIDLRQLRYFVAIVEQGSLSRASAHLHVAQPALSLHVRNMEAYLGTDLLLRTPRGVEPTEAGTILLRHSRTILDQLTVAEEQIREKQNDPEGEVRLGLPGTIGQIIAVPLIKAVRLRYPKIKLRIAEAMSGFVLEWMREGRVDLAVLYGHIDDHGIRTERLLEERLRFFGPPANLCSASLPPDGGDVPFRLLVKFPLILPGRGHGLRNLLDRQAEAINEDLSTTIDVDSYGNIKSLVEAGLGYSILPESAIAAEITEAQLRSWTITEPRIFRTIYLAHSASRPTTNAMSAVLNLTRDILRDLANTGQWEDVS